MRTTYCAVVAALLGSAGIASAAKVTADDFAAGLNDQVVTRGGIDVLLHAEPGGTAFENPGGGIGVANGGGGSEAGFHDSLTFNFSEEVLVNRLQISKLFAKGYAGDLFNEGVKITTDNGSYTFFANALPAGASLQNQSFGGNLVSVDGAYGGNWRLAGDGLFGGAITFIKLEATPQGLTRVYADFTFQSMSFKAYTPEVPAPGAAAALGMGGLLASRRRRR